MNIQHSHRTDHWQTPDNIISKVRNVMGDIGLDPASSRKANERIRATRFLTKLDDALECPWMAEGRSIFLNPPGGKVKNKSKTCLFWIRLMEHRKVFDQAIFLAFSTEALQNTQGKVSKAGEVVRSLGEFLICIPSKRIKFYNPDEPEKSSPAHSNVIAYIPGIIDNSDFFIEHFSDVGVILNRP